MYEDLNNLVWLAWCSLTASTISKCFAHRASDFTEEVVPEQEVTPDALNQPGDEYKELLGGVSCDNYITVYDDTITSDTAGEKWEAVITSKAKGEK